VHDLKRLDAAFDMRYYSPAQSNMSGDKPPLKAKSAPTDDIGPSKNSPPPPPLVCSLPVIRTSGFPLIGGANNGIAVYEREVILFFERRPGMSLAGLVVCIFGVAIALPIIFWLLVLVL
jgi:hypothetical protein